MQGLTAPSATATRRELVTGDDSRLGFRAGPFLEKERCVADTHASAPQGRRSSHLACWAVEGARQATTSLVFMMKALPLYALALGAAIIAMTLGADLIGISALLAVVFRRPLLVLALTLATIGAVADLASRQRHLLSWLHPRLVHVCRTRHSVLYEPRRVGTRECAL